VSNDLIVEDRVRRGTEFQSALRRCLVRREGSINRIAEKLVDLAEAGEEWAVEMVANRLDGKPIQQVATTSITASVSTEMLEAISNMQRGELVRMVTDILAPKAINTPSAPPSEPVAEQ
jgi:hypothetical protein